MIFERKKYLDELIAGRGISIFLSSVRRFDGFAIISG